MRVYYKTLSVDIGKESGVECMDLKQNSRLVDLLLALFPQGFERKTDVYINNELIEVKDYDVELDESDVITIDERPRYTYIAQILIMIVINVVISLIMKKLNKPKNVDSSTGRSIYTSNINQIMSNIGAPFPIQYGRVRRYPNLIAPQFSFFHNNEEYVVIHTALGIGQYKIHDTYLDKTSNANLDMYHYKDNDPKSQPLKFWTFLDNPKTNKNIHKDFKKSFSSIVPESYLGYITYHCENINSLQFNKGARIYWHTINDKGTRINQVVVNLTFPGGLYTISSKGEFESASVAVDIVLLEIDDDDRETGFRKIIEHTFEFKDKTAIRQTFNIQNLKSGRYKIGIFRN